MLETMNTQALAKEAVDLAPLAQVLDEFRTDRGAIIGVLQKTQAIYGYLPTEALQYIAKGLNVPLSRIYGVATFYAQFYLQRRGRNIVRICDGTACHVRGSAKIIEELEKELGIHAGETTPDYRVTLEAVYCLGSCGLSPIAVINEQVVGRLVPDKAKKLVRELK